MQNRMSETAKTFTVVLAF